MRYCEEFSPTLVVKGGIDHHPTYAFVLALHKRINSGMVGWTLEALYVGLSNHF
jgi:hypothetical protein